MRVFEPNAIENFSFGWNVWGAWQVKLSKFQLVRLTKLFNKNFILQLHSPHRSTILMLIPIWMLHNVRRLRYTLFLPLLGRSQISNTQVVEQKLFVQFDGTVWHRPRNQSLIKAEDARICWNNFAFASSLQPTSSTVSFQKRGSHLLSTTMTVISTRLGMAFHFIHKFMS